MEKYTWHFIASHQEPDDEGRFQMATEAYVLEGTEEAATKKVTQLLPGREHYFLRSCNEHDQETLSEFQQMYLANMNKLPGQD